MIDFLVDENKTFSYADLFAAVNDIESISTVVQEKDYFTLFVQYVAAIVYGVDITVVDSDLSAIEKKNLGKKSFTIKTQGEPAVESFQDLLSIFEQRKKTWRLTLFTSGTTGRPKTVTHTLSSLTRMVRTGDRYEKSVWGFAYNPTHFAGFQVFFQALYNCNKVVRLFGRPYTEIALEIDSHHVTHISATPTFVRGLVGLLAAADQAFSSVRRITTGGERFDERLVGRIENHFPNARVNNIYASTEAGSLFVGHGDLLSVPESLREFVSFSDTNEILLHKSLLGTADELEIAGNWYNTGDIVDEPNHTGFRIQGRRSDFINVGGYKVNPHEVEATVRTIVGVTEVRCYGISNPITGKLVAVDVVSNGAVNAEEMESRIDRVCQSALQDYKRPRIINIVKTIDQTHTGKLKR